MRNNMKAFKIYLVVLLSIIFFGCSNLKDDKQLTIDIFTKALASNGMSLGKKTEKMYGLLMATDGYSIDVNGESIEIYQFNTTIKSGKDAIENWKNEGYMGHSVVVNRNLMLFTNNKHKNWEEIIKVFNEL
jgi:hypothetical protein